MEYIVGAIIGVLGLVVVFLKGKKNSAEAIVNNLDTLIKDLTLKEKQIESSAKAEVAKEEIRELENEESKAKQNANDADVNDTLDFWSKRKGK